MNEQSQIRAIVDKLGEKKEPFLADVKSSINKHISEKSWQECLTIVERYPSGRIHSTWEPEASAGYVKRLMKFMRKKRHDGYDLDSQLTDGVVALVTGKFEKFYMDNTYALAEPLMKQLMKDKAFVNQLASQIIDISEGPLPKVIKSRLMEKMIDALQDAANVNISKIALDTILGVTSKIVAASAALPITKSMAMILIKNVAFMLKGVIAKILASTAFKTAATAIIKKLVAVQIISVVISLVGPALGSVSIMYFVVPLVAMFIAYEVATLPQSMGEKVSDAVVAELRGEFDKMNQNVAIEIMKSFTASAIGSLARDIAHDPEFKKFLEEIAKR